MTANTNSTQNIVEKSAAKCGLSFQLKEVKNLNEASTPSMNHYKHLVTVLLLLAIADAYFTDLGLRNDHVTEANPLMDLLYTNSVLGFYLIKISLPFALLLIISKIQPKRYLKCLIGFTLILYSFVITQHFLWIYLLSGF